jgi:hypothetical protein
LTELLPLARFELLPGLLGTSALYEAGGSGKNDAVVLCRISGVRLNMTGIRAVRELLVPPDMRVVSRGDSFMRFRRRCRL